MGMLREPEIHCESDYFGAVSNAQVQSGGSTIAGTFGYMAPEQNIGRATPASDTYALAALAAYSGMAGMIVFRGMRASLIQESLRGCSVRSDISVSRRTLTSGKPCLMNRRTGRISPNILIPINLLIYICFMIGLIDLFKITEFIFTLFCDEYICYIFM